MISASDILHVINEIHQRNVLLLELKDSVTFGICLTGDGKLNCFRLEGKLDRASRMNIVQMVSSGDLPPQLQLLSVERFLSEIDGKKTRHIWLETRDAERRELGFVSLHELKAFFRHGITR